MRLHRQRDIPNATYRMCQTGNASIRFVSVYARLLPATAQIEFKFNWIVPLLCFVYFRPNLNEAIYFALLGAARRCSALFDAARRFLARHIHRATLM